MRYEIPGGAFPVVVCHLAAGEQMITEKGSMVWQSPNMKMETRGGGLGRMFSKALSGESMFQNIFTAENGPGMVTFGSSFPGRILPMRIEPGRELILQKSAFLAAETGVELSIHFSRKLSAGFFGGAASPLWRSTARPWNTNWPPANSWWWTRATSPASRRACPWRYGRSPD